MKTRKTLHPFTGAITNQGRVLFALLLPVVLGLLAPDHSRASAATGGAGSFHSQFTNTHNRVWLGAQYWANPMEDWQVKDGRIECLSRGGNRNVHLLTRQLRAGRGRFTLSVRCGVLERGPRGGAGFRVGIHDDINDYRSDCFFGQGIQAGLGNGFLYLDHQSTKLATEPSMEDMLIQLHGEPKAGGYALTLTVTDHLTGQVIGKATVDGIAADRLVGNLALVNNFAAQVRNGSRFWFADWQVSGDKIEAHPERAWGPILWSMYTLSNNRSAEGYVLKLTAQLPPMGAEDRDTVRLQIQRQGQWQILGEQKIGADSRAATFRIPHWNQQADTPYRLVYTETGKDGQARDTYWPGTIRREPTGRPVKVAGMTGQFFYGFPYAPVAENLKHLGVDVLFFSGDQIYEANGGYGIIREPADRAILNYLRKWYLFGWAFGDVMRDRPTIVLPDDHDVFQGNLWGEAGAPMPKGGSDSSSGGYLEPLRMIHVVYATSCAHHPDFYDPTPIKQGMGVFYGDMVYGRVSLAIIADRQFKSGPENVSTGNGRPDWVLDPNFNMDKLEKPGLQLLGPRQEKFLKHWVADWRGADMKMVLSQTIFANATTHSGQRANYLQADLDSGGWPRAGRDRAIRLMREGFALHLSGDQHLALLIQYGVDQPRDSDWAFCVPSVAAGYQRWWLPDEIGRPHTERPAHGLPDTGEYRDGFGNLIYVSAVGNPAGSQAPNRYLRAQIKSSGFGLVRVNTQQHTYTCDCYHFLANALDGNATNQFAGWPLTISQTDNYGRPRAGYLPECIAPVGVTNAVVKVTHGKTGELVYALRCGGHRFKPFVFESGTYTVEIGDPDTDQWTVLKGQTIRTK